MTRPPDFPVPLRVMMVLLVIALVILLIGAAKAGEFLDRDPFGPTEWLGDAELQMVYMLYYPVGPSSNSSHHHNYVMCRSHFCFPARPGSTKWTPDGIRVVLPDGSHEIVPENSHLWLKREGTLLQDWRDHICFNYFKGRWSFRGGFRGAPRV